MTAGHEDATRRGDEGRHPAGPELDWVESWTFDFVAADGTVGGWSRLALLPNRRVAWYHAFLVGPDRQLLAVIDDAVPLPGRGLEIRTEGLWATHICETPLDHWTIGLEAFALGVDDPAELYGRQYGDRVPLGFDLEWEAASGPVAAPGGYQQPCRVTGEILVGAAAIDLDGWGHRDHRWGPSEAWDSRWVDLRGRLADGTTFAATVVDGDLASATGAVDGHRRPVHESSESADGLGLPTGARVKVGDLEIGLDPVAVTPLELADVEQRTSRAPRALCRVTAADGRTGHAWAEFNRPVR